MMLGFIELFPPGLGGGLLPYISQIAMCNLRQALPMYQTHPFTLTNQNILNKTNFSEKLTPYISCEEEGVGRRAQISAWTEEASQKKRLNFLM